MPSNKLLQVFIVFALLFSSSIAQETSSPSPAPVTGPYGYESPSIPSPSPSIGSINPPPHSDLPPNPASTPSSPAPAPEEASDTTSANVESEKPKNSSSGGMSGGKKAGIAIGVIVAACAVVLGGMLYKKRKQNIQRAQLGHAARGEFL
ncbi:hypothetical protein L6452_11213 [Arctium lappa]|uniref:Uncharacterized protein n=1 Tax=Arctium lappa TaxID=4217 RepID=A0ACB9DP80_ARCLA|nr:hypothetical protein L6452_11213 [Arctium lappa]